MKFLYAPWRSSYTDEVHEGKQENSTAQECVFCLQHKEGTDAQHWIIKRFIHCYVALNKYPYNAGHLLILPYEHKAELTDLSAIVRTELMETITHATQVLNTTLNSQGANIGINLGKAAGAGIPAHLHIHVLPRWYGDTNFMPTIAQVRHISFDLNETYKKLVDGFNR